MKKPTAFEAKLDRIANATADLLLSDPPDLTPQEKIGAFRALASYYSMKRRLNKTEERSVFDNGLDETRTGRGRNGKLAIDVADYHDPYGP